MEDVEDHINPSPSIRFRKASCRDDERLSFCVVDPVPSIHSPALKHLNIFVHLGTGSLFIQEDSSQEIGKAISDWLPQ